MLLSISQNIIKKTLSIVKQMARFGEKEIAKETFFAAKNPINIWNVNFDNIVISK